ncbi:MAG: hypothetical protein IJX99_07630 [Clostridia bacterium]|nr:hypothetical protein [Clostridia bacterium]
MRINSSGYRLWKKRRDQKILKSKSKRRPKKKKSTNVLITPRENISALIPFEAPRNFSFKNNDEETINFFNMVLNYVKLNIKKRKKKKGIFVDISNVENLTIDSLMYLIAVIKNLKNIYRNNYKFSGNFPSEKEVRELLLESGFLNYVKTNVEFELKPISNNIQIRSGTNVDTDVVKDILDFIIENVGIAKNRLGIIYDMLIELMSNTKNHAYNSENIFLNSWYIFLEIKDGKLKFSFLDIGDGIPNTVHKTLSEKLKIGEKKNDSYYILSALNGEFRTSTNIKNRGKGLPGMDEYCKNEQLEKFKVISGKGIIELNDELKYNVREAENELIGTLYYWENDISKLKGE